MEELTAEQEESEVDPGNQRSIKRNAQMHVPSEDRPKNQASNKRKAELEVQFADQPWKKANITKCKRMDLDLKDMLKKHEKSRQGTTDDGDCCVQKVSKAQSTSWSGVTNAKAYLSNSICYNTAALFSLYRPSDLAKTTGGLSVMK